MINMNHAKNKSWTPGSTVKVGFLTLRVKRVEAVKDGLPDIYYLEDMTGQRQYRFIPHNGLERLK